MKKTHTKKAGFASLFVLLSLPFVFANPIEQFFNIIAFNPVSVYESSRGFIDLILFIMFFVGISMKLLTERIGKKAAIAFGFMLAVGLSVWMMMRGITLASFGPVWMGVILFIMAYMIYYLAYQLIQPPETHRFLAAALAYVLIYPMYKVAAPEFFDWLRQIDAQFPVSPLLDLLWWGLVIYLVVTLIRSMLPTTSATPAAIAPRIGGGGGGGGTTPVHPNPDLVNLHNSIRRYSQMQIDYTQAVQQFIGTAQQIHLARSATPPTITQDEAYRRLRNAYSGGMFMGSRMHRLETDIRNTHYTIIHNAQFATLPAPDRALFNQTHNHFLTSFRDKQRMLLQTLRAI
jgi:hypothetical protein